MSGKDDSEKDNGQNNDLDADARPDDVEREVAGAPEDGAVNSATDESATPDGKGYEEDENAEAALEAALAEAEKFRDVALRAEAEMQNVRRRAGIDVENAHRFALERFVNNLLPVVDSLEKAVESIEQTEAMDDTTQAIAEGVGLCQKMFVDVLEKEGVAVVDPVGEPFDPNLHQAMSMVENPDVEPNSVVAVVQRGYTLNDRLVRPAMVMVSKASEGTN
ncbi:MAG: nucleotide exchange factor GrpE [Pseudomonadota bacterium]